MFDVGRSMFDVQLAAAAVRHRITLSDFHRRCAGLNIEHRTPNIE
jgi:hypothetical protein